MEKAGPSPLGKVSKAIRAIDPDVGKAFGTLPPNVGGEGHPRQPTSQPMRIQCRMQASRVEPKYLSGRNRWQRSVSCVQAIVVW